MVATDESMKRVRKQNTRPVMVMAGSFWTGSTEHGLAGGFRDEGWVVREVEQRHFLPAGKTLAERMLARLTTKARSACYEEAVLLACRHLHPDVLFTVKGSYLSRRVFESARDLGIRSVCFWPDYHFGHLGTDVEGLLQSDLFITSKSFQMPWLDEHGLGDRSAFVAHGYDPVAHQPVLDVLRTSDYTADIRYIGSHSLAKQRWVEGLHEALPDVNLRIIGNRWERSLRRPLARRLIEATEYVAADYSLAIQTARINIAFHMGKADNGWEDLVSTRTFEIPACGGFMLHIDNDEVREYYEVGTEIDVFAGPEELADKCRFYLTHDEERRRMAVRAHERCVPAYSYHARAREMQELIAGAA